MNSYYEIWTGSGCDSTTPNALSEVVRRRHLWPRRYQSCEYFLHNQVINHNQHSLSTIRVRWISIIVSGVATSFRRFHSNYRSYPWFDRCFFPQKNRLGSKGNSGLSFFAKMTPFSALYSGQTETKWGSLLNIWQLSTDGWFLKGAVLLFESRGVKSKKSGTYWPHSSRTFGYLWLYYLVYGGVSHRCLELCGNFDVTNALIFILTHQISE